MDKLKMAFSRVAMCCGQKEEAVTGLRSSSLPPSGGKVTDAHSATTAFVVPHQAATELPSRHRSLTKRLARAISSVGNGDRQAGDPSGRIQNVPRGTGFGNGELKFQRLHTGEHMMCSGWGNRLFCWDSFAYEIAQYFCCFSRDRVSPLTHCEARSAPVLLPQPSHF